MGTATRHSGNKHELLITTLPIDHALSFGESIFSFVSRVLPLRKIFDSTRQRGDVSVA